MTSRARRTRPSRAASGQALMIDRGAFDRAANYLIQEWSKVPAADLEMRAMIQPPPLVR